MLTTEQYKSILDDLAAVRNRVDCIKLDIQTYRAEMYLKIKHNPQNFGLEKATENTIESVINTASKTLELEHELLAAKDNLNRVYAKYDLAKFEMELMKNQLTEIE